MPKGIRRPTHLIDLLQHKCLHELALISLPFECCLACCVEVNSGVVTKEEPDLAIAAVVPLGHRIPAHASCTIVRVTFVLSEAFARPRGT